MIDKELHKGDIIVVETNGKRIFGVIVTNNNLNYNQDQVGMVNISTQTDGVCLAYVDIFTNQPAKAICNKVWNVWKSDVVEFVRECSTEEMNDIDKAMRWTFGMVEPQKTANDTRPILYTNSNVSVSDYEEMKTYIEKLEKTNINLQAENDSVVSENKNMQKQLEKAREDTDHWIEQAAKAGETTPNVAALTAERDTYRAMYEALIDRMFKR